MKSDNGWGVRIEFKTKEQGSQWEIWGGGTASCGSSSYSPTYSCTAYLLLWRCSKHLWNINFCGERSQKTVIKVCFLIYVIFKFHSLELSLMYVYFLSSQKHYFPLRWFSSKSVDLHSGIVFVLILSAFFFLVLKFSTCFKVYYFYFCHSLFFWLLFLVYHSKCSFSVYMSIFGFCYRLDRVHLIEKSAIALILRFLSQYLIQIKILWSLFHLVLTKQI